MSQQQQQQIHHNEQIVLQQINQLSPFKQNNNNREEKQSNIDLTKEEKAMITMDFDYIPEYLCNTNPSLENKINCILPTTMKLEETRDIALLMHKMMSIETIQSLWIMYRNSGIGNIAMTSSLSTRTNQINVKVWPEEVQSLLERSHRVSTDEHHTCLMFVNYCLNDLNMKGVQYRQELNIKTTRLRNYSRSLEHVIEKFIEKNLQILRMEIDEKKAMVQYNYTDEILHRTYLAQKPNENQIQIMKHLCQLKSNQEMTRHEVNFFKIKIPSHLTSHPFDHESIAQSPLINSITDEELQKQFYQQYKDAAEQARIKMMASYMECAEGQKQQCQEQYDKEMKDIENTQRLLTSPMWNLIKQRLVNIRARVECLYKFKTDSFHLSQLHIH